MLQSTHQPGCCYGHTNQDPAMDTLIRMLHGSYQPGRCVGHQPRFCRHSLLSTPLYTTLSYWETKHWHQHALKRGVH
eukprot:312804-Chlamydomonas_euryale.AAC.3